jgi:hypothetical protein
VRLRDVQRWCKRTGAAIHYRRKPERWQRHELRDKPACGQKHGGWLTSKADAVTCRKCKRLLFGGGFTLTVSYR